MHCGLCVPRLERGNKNCSGSLFSLLLPVFSDSQQLCSLAPEFKLLLAGQASGQRGDPFRAFPFPLNTFQLTALFSLGCHIQCVWAEKTIFDAHFWLQLL